jgi:hypothetical protein
MMEKPARKVAPARVAGVAAVKIAPIEIAISVLLRIFANILASKDWLGSLAPSYCPGSISVSGKSSRNINVFRYCQWR